MTSDSNDSPQEFNESLKMLESDEGQRNAVFACYGSAAQHAQLFEQGLKKFHIMYNKIFHTTLTLADFEELEAKLQKRTMGQLLVELYKHVKFPDPEVEDDFKEALLKRNFLMHHFFLERDSELKSKPGRFKLLAELLSIEGVLDRGRIRINAMRIAMCRELGVADEA